MVYASILWSRWCQKISRSAVVLFHLGCNTCKISNKSCSGLVHPIIAWNPLHLVVVNLHGLVLQGYRWCTLFLINIFIKHVKVYAISETTIRTLIKKINGFIRKLGLMKCILSDNGSQFTAKELFEFWNNKGCRSVIQAATQTLTHLSMECDILGTTFVFIVIANTSRSKKGETTWAVFELGTIQQCEGNPILAHVPQATHRSTP